MDYVLSFSIIGIVKTKLFHNNYLLPAPFELNLRAQCDPKNLIL